MTINELSASIGLSKVIVLHTDYNS